jgi:hypothetical protein
MEQMMGLQLIQFDERNRKVPSDRERVISFNMAKIKWLSRTVGLCNEISCGSLWPLRPINLLLMLCFGVQATLSLNLWSFRTGSRTGGKVHSTVMRFHLHLDEYATVIYASSRSQWIISTRRLPEKIREMKTVMLTGFIYTRLCDITACSK